MSNIGLIYLVTNKRNTLCYIILKFGGDETFIGVSQFRDRRQILLLLLSEVERINPFPPNAPLLYPLNTLENLTVF